MYYKQIPHEVCLISLGSCDLPGFSKRSHTDYPKNKICLPPPRVLICTTGNISNTENEDNRRLPLVRNRPDFCSYMWVSYLDLRDSLQISSSLNFSRALYHWNLEWCFGLESFWTLHQVVWFWLKPSGCGRYTGGLHIGAIHVPGTSIASRLYYGYFFSGPQDFVPASPHAYSQGASCLRNCRIRQWSKCGHQPSGQP